MARFSCQVLRRLYEEEKLSLAEVAKRLHSYPNAVLRAMRECGIKTRSKGKAQQTALREGRVKHPTRGRARSPQERARTSKSLKEHWAKAGQEERTRKVDGARARWAAMSEEERADFRQAAVDGIKNAARIGSKLERFLLRELRKTYTVIHRHLLADLFLPEPGIAIQVDGPAHFYPIWGEERLLKTQLADLQREEKISSLNFHLIRLRHFSGKISGSDKEKALTEVLGRIQSIVKNESQERVFFIDLGQPHG